jgi:hypothetical protein
MKRRWLLLFGVFVTAVLGAGYLLIPVGEGITQANCDKIQKGWSEKEVEELLGMYTTRIDGSGTLIGDPPQNFSAYKVWSNDDGDSISAFFNEQGVIEKNFTRGELSLMERIRRRIARRLPARR